MDERRYRLNVKFNSPRRDVMDPDGFGRFSLSLHVENYRDSERPGYLEMMFRVTDYIKMLNL